MNQLFPFLHPEIVVPLGWTLIHSLWQGFIIAAILWVLFRFTKKLGPRTTYWICGFALLGLLATSTLTFVSLYKHKNLVPQSVGATPISVTPKIEAAQSPIHEAFTGVAPWVNSNISWIVALWLLGFAIAFIKLAGGFFYTQRLKATRRPVPLHWRQILHKLAHKAGLGMPLAMAESAAIQTPMILGHFKPLILLPLGTLTMLSPQEVEAILLHELGHVARKDFLLNLIQSGVDAVFFYHPAVWWISSQMRKERELCCDDLALSVTKDPKTLANALANLQEVHMRSPQLGLALGGASNQLLKRIQRLVRGPESNHHIGTRLAAFALVVTGLSMLSFNAWAQLPNNTNMAIAFQDSDEKEREAVYHHKLAIEKKYHELKLLEKELYHADQKLKNSPEKEKQKVKETKEKIRHQMANLKEELVAMQKKAKASSRKYKEKAEKDAHYRKRAEKEKKEYIRLKEKKEKEAKKREKEKY